MALPAAFQGCRTLPSLLPALRPPLRPVVLGAQGLRAPLPGHTRSGPAASQEEPLCPAPGAGVGVRVDTGLGDPQEQGYPSSLCTPSGHTT